MTALFEPATADPDVVEQKAWESIHLGHSQESAGV